MSFFDYLGITAGFGFSLGFSGETDKIDFDLDDCFSSTF